MKGNKLFVLFFSLVLIGVTYKLLHEKGNGLLPDQAITKVDFCYSTAFGERSRHCFASFADNESIRTIADAIGTARPMPGVANVVRPETDIRVTLGNDSSLDFHLWLSDDGKSGMIMSTSDTHRIYSLRLASSMKLSALLHEK